MELGEIAVGPHTLRLCRMDAGVVLERILISILSRQSIWVPWSLRRYTRLTSAWVRIAAMTVYGWLIFALWLILVAYWILAACAVRRSLGGRWIWRREIALRLGFFALVVLVLQVGGVGQALPNTGLYSLNRGMLTGFIGFVLAAYGIGLAILARAYLGPRWAAPLSNGESLELVTTGPYAWVRHPLYSGMLLAMIGSAIGQSVFWLLPLIVYGPNFILSARREEKFLIEQCPERYRAYRKRTKMLLPFVI